MYNECPKCAEERQRFKDLTEKAAAIAVDRDRWKTLAEARLKILQHGQDKITGVLMQFETLLDEAHKHGEIKGE